MAARKTITVGDWQNELARAMQHYKIAAPVSTLEQAASMIRKMSERGVLASVAALEPLLPNRDVARVLRQLLAQGRIIRVVATRGNRPAAYVYNPETKR